MGILRDFQRSVSPRLYSVVADHRRKGRRCGFLIALCGTLAAPVVASGESPDFASDIKPIFESRCYACHGAGFEQSEYRLDLRDRAFRGGGSGVAAISPGNSGDSLLYRYVAGVGETRMPPVEPYLTSEQVERIRQWIDEGAEWPDDQPGAEAEDELSKIERARGHWAFQPPMTHSPPDVRNRVLAARVRNPIDAFVIAKLEERGWEPSPLAGPRQLLRRVYLDLTGLPPTVDEQDSFLRDPTPSGLDRVIEELLARPSYGERWARHWLDLVRYADTNGYERDAIKPAVWRYRDYVIRSLNEDKPFDRFAIEQLAGDEIPDVSTETLVATGFHRLGPWDDEPADPLTDRYDQLDDLARTTSEVFLGLTLGCARCHNHKFEPLTARDYYSIVAVFAPLNRPQDGRTELLRPIGGRAELNAWEERDARIRRIEDEIATLWDKARAEFLESGQSALPPRVVRAFQAAEGQRDQVQVATVKEFSGQLGAELEAALPIALRHRISNLEGRICELYSETPTTDSGYILHEPRSQPPTSYLLIRGSASNPGPEVEPATPEVLAFRAEFPEWRDGNPTSLRRLALAKWIASPRNPLTARVIVNRIWQFHFGEGIVRTPSDFGLMGERPTHPELLDWLANWFVRNRWSLKALHRLIMSSNTYRMSKSWDDDYGSTDPSSRFLWRMPYRRLEVEAIRDSMLAASGRLNPRMYGPSMYPYVPPAALEGSSDPDKIWTDFDEEDASRRTIYALVKRSMIVPMLEVLDFCDTTRSSAMRTSTAVPTQALTLFNGEFVNRQARYLARRLVVEAPGDRPAQIDLAFRLAFARRPANRERDSLMELLQEEEARGGAGTQGRLDALTQVCRVLFNMNEMAYVE